MDIKRIFQGFLFSFIFSITLAVVILDPPQERNSKNFGFNRNQASYNACKTPSNLRGSCMKRNECSKYGGSASGYCGTYEVCCELNLPCNGISGLKRTTIRNPNPVPKRCTYHFQPFNQNVCQLRVDFDLILSQPTIPNTNNTIQGVTCVNDYFQVRDLKLCGTNNMQHIYVPFDVQNGESDVSLIFMITNRNQSNSMITPFWNLLVTQIECPQLTSKASTIFGLPMPGGLKHFKEYFKPQRIDTDLIAPPGCLQYFQDTDGVFESFNYNGGIGPYFANLRYGICFKRSPMDTQVHLTGIHFEIGAASNDTEEVDGDCHDILDTPGRSNDYLLIAESVLASNPPLYGTQYCGSSLQGLGLILAPPAPFAIYFNSDDIYSTLVPEVGFKFSYSIQ